MSDENINPENLTTEHRDKILQQRAQQVMQTGMAIGGGGVNRDVQPLIQALAEGRTITALTSELKEVNKALGFDKLPETVEERKEREKFSDQEYINGTGSN